MGRPSISLVIPTYNSGHLVVDAINSVLAQTDPADELIVIDDGSIDDTSERLAGYGDRIRAVSQPNAGVSAARNHGVRLANCDYVAFLDADDVWHPRKLEFQRKALEARPDLGLLGCFNINWPAAAFPEWAEGEAEQIVPLNWETFLIRVMIQTSSIVVRKSIFDQLGGFDRTLRSAEDRDLWMRIAQVSPIAYLPVPFVGYRYVEGSLSNQLALVNEKLNLLRKLDASGGWQGKWLFRRSAYGNAYASCAYQLSAARDYRGAFASMLRSFLWYPMPFAGDEGKISFDRVTGLLAYTLGLLGLKREKPRQLTEKLATQPREMAASQPIQEK